MKNVLIVFPCAGGNAQNFLRFSKDIMANVVRVEYSGHWSRYDEPLYVSFDELLRDVMKYIKTFINFDGSITNFVGLYIPLSSAPRARNFRTTLTKKENHPHERCTTA